MSDQTDEIFLKYYYNRRDTFKTEQRDDSDKFIALEVLSTSRRPARQINLTEPTAMYLTVVADGPQKSWFGFRGPIKAM